MLEHYCVQRRNYYKTNKRPSVYDTNKTVDLERRAEALSSITGDIATVCVKALLSVAWYSLGGRNPYNLPK